MKLSPSWTFVGVCAVVGAYWCAVRAYTAADLVGEAWPYVAHGVGAAVAGALLCALGPLRPSKEPVAAALIAIAVMALVLIALPHPTYSWVAARSTHPALAVAMIAAISTASAFAGAMAVRRVAGDARGGAVASALLGGAVACGLLVLAGMALHLTGLASSRATEMVLTLVAASATGYGLQHLIAPDVRVALGFGVGGLLFLVALPEARARGSNAVLSAAVSACFAAWVTAVAAQLARKRRR